MPWSWSSGESSIQGGPRPATLHCRCPATCQAISGPTLCVVVSGSREGGPVAAGHQYYPQLHQAEVERSPMSPPKPLAMQVGEVFRVDAKAQGDQIVIGGWESLGGISARWFSVTLDRRSAPWAYAKAAVPDDRILGDDWDASGSVRFRQGCHLERQGCVSCVGRLHGQLWQCLCRR